MTVAITGEHHAARLAATLAFLDLGPAPARLRIYGGTRPAVAGDTPSSVMLVQIALTKPAGTLIDGLLALTQDLTDPENGMISASDQATWARLVNGAEATAADLDCSDLDGNGDLKLLSTQLYLGGLARLMSATLG